MKQYKFWDFDRDALYRTSMGDRSRYSHVNKSGKSTIIMNDPSILIYTDEKYLVYNKEILVGKVK